MSMVPVTEWAQAFGILSRIIARAAKYAAEGCNKPQCTNVIRWALAKAAIPRFRELLARNPGIESPEEIVKFAIEAVMSVDPRDAAELFLNARPTWSQYYSVDELAMLIAKAKENVYKSVQELAAVGKLPAAPAVVAA